MYKKLLSLCIIIFLLLFNICYSQAISAPKIKAEAAILIDYKTGEVLYEKNMHKRRPPASTTKIMTAILAIESGKLDDIVRISSRAAATRGSSMHLASGQVITLRELLNGLLLRSGNDAAVAIAEHLGGTTDNFVHIMNEKADLLGAYNTHFCNPHGLSAANHYSTAFDLAIMTRYALSLPLFAQIVSTKHTKINWLDRKGNTKDQNLRNTNKLLWMLPEADGVKTGTTSQAGQCLVSSATFFNQKLIAVVLHDSARWFDSMRLLKYGFDNFNLYVFRDANDILQTVPVDNGYAPYVNAIAASTSAIVVSSQDCNHVTVEIDLPEKLEAPVYQGQKIGEIVFRIREQPIKTFDIVAGQEILERTVTRSIMYEVVRSLKYLSHWGIF